MDSTLETLVLIRHARSAANADPAVSLTIPDHAVPLVSPDEDADAMDAGARVADLALDPAEVCIWLSPYLRCQQTETLTMARAFGARAAEIDRRESFLLREQEFGDWEGLNDDDISTRDPFRFEKLQRMRDAFGKFYFRYPNGESRADVVQRIAIFIGKIHRSRYRHHVVFLHGVTQRAFRMAWFNHSVAWFEEEPNPANASVLVIQRDGSGRWAERYAGTSG